MSATALVDLGSALADVFTYLAPADQQELRATTTDLCSWFDVAAENGSLPFFAHAPAGGKWKYSPVNPRSAETPAVVTANVRNYYFSTMNTYHITNEAVKAPQLTGNDEFVATDVEVHSFIFQGLKCKKLIVTGMNGIKSIEKRFCEKVTAEEIVFTGGANQLESVSMHWMLRCPNLKKVVLEGPFPKLASVSNCWMAECPKLETVDFSGITALKKIDDRCMFNSPNITDIDFTPFAATLEIIGTCFLGHVTKVANLDQKLRLLTSVKEVNTVGQYAPPAVRAFAKGKEPATE